MNRKQQRSRDYKSKAILVFLTILLAGIAFLSLGFGTVYVTPGETLAIWTEENQQLSFLINNLRMPRTVIAVLGGAGLAVSGAILQGVIRNPLISPDVVGLTNGAGLFAVIVLILLPQAPIGLLPAAAFFGAALVAVLLVALARKSGMNPATLALIGIGLGAGFQALTEYILTKYPMEANESLVWLAGSLWGKGWDDVYGLLPWMTVLLPTCLLLYRRLDILSLNEEASIGLGMNVRSTRLLLLTLAVALAGAAVATIGAIGFIGLVAPHMARGIFGSRHQYLLPGSMILGSLLLVVADTAGRTIRPPIEIPAGILTAIIGVPYFLYLIRRELKES
ncbi:iron chelate uptake ABC transporter family permease subunit [Bacillus sp. SB49]|uniref:FecCD family ABC transporter permease n=1 Tax=Bacillaceae TaxID=186817 RepID=UPI0002A4DFBD|nr:MULTISPECIES: iron chelate uptake ABC transporter family permease subunit [Bacillaceae]ELK48097.1 Vitamin B12 import system permease protein btuC [Halobacillus sp. BAB-2008]QHT45602.1 iron chelate uptake ABC transporter family permease subunit [Bacillus sp. SB49]